MAELSPEVARAARRWADQQNAAIAAVPAGLHIGTVAAASPLTVTWRNRTVSAFKNAAYTPAVGDRVLFGFATDQLIVICKIG